MKNRKIYLVEKSTPTLTQSGLLAVLLQRQRHKVIELAQRRAHREQMHSAFSSIGTWLLTRAHDVMSGRRYRRGFEETVPRRT